MTLKLDIVGPQAAALGAAAHKVFSGVGGTIGRLPDNDWVLPDPYISGRHARVHCRNGQYLLEDTSSNGVFINSPDRRLARGEMYALQAGDRVFIDAYEIRVTLMAAAASPSASPSPLADLFGSAPAASGAHIPDDPFGSSDPFKPQPHAAKPAGRSLIPDDFTFGGDPAASAGSGESTDPLKLLGLEGKRAPTAPVPRARDLARGSVLNDHYEPPAPITTPLREPSSAVADALIPEGYDPLLDDLAPGGRDPFSLKPAAPRPTPGPRPAAPPETKAVSPQRSAPPPPKPQAQPPVHRAPVVPTPAVNYMHPEPQAPATDQFDFASMLAGAGLQGVQVTPELAENFGRILRIVVTGLMDVLRARERTKDEFRMRMTTFKTTDNNPLKFSANVEDALHNLLVKRNSAYLGPAEAFEDAFQDVRNHQMAMLAGVRVAFEAMLNEFDPEHLQELFDRQIKKGSLIAAPARMRYWDLYRDKFHDMVKDPENNFRELFGDEFAHAYEEQLESLKATARAQRK
jgi:type VI secretion system FHA domain protein